METEKKIRKFENYSGYEHYVVYSNKLWWDENGYTYDKDQIDTKPAGLSEESENILCEICDIAANDRKEKRDSAYMIAKREYSFDVEKRLEALAKDFAHSRGQLSVKEFADELNTILKEYVKDNDNAEANYLSGFKFGSISQCRLYFPHYSTLDKIVPFSPEKFNFDNVLMTEVLGNIEIEIPYKHFVDEAIIQKYEEENDDDFPWTDYIPSDDWMKWADSVVHMLNTGECYDDMDMNMEAACTETVEKLQFKDRSSIVKEHLYFEDFKEAGFYRNGETVSWITQYQFELPKKLTKETAQELFRTIVAKVKEAKENERTLYEFEREELEEDEQDLD